MTTPTAPVSGKKRNGKTCNLFAVGLLTPAVILLSFTIILPVFLVIGLSFFKYSLHK